MCNFKSCFVLVAFLCHATLAVAQPLPVDGKMLSKDQCLQDFEILYSTITNYHPAPYQYIAKDEISAYYHKKRNAFADSVTERTFFLEAKRLLALIRCGHTAGSISSDWYTPLKGNAVLLPFTIQRVDNRAFINNTVDTNFAFSIGDELLSINGIPTEHLLTEMDSLVQTDGYNTTFKNKKVARNFRMYFFFLYGHQEQFNLEFKRPNGLVEKTMEISHPKKMMPTPKQKLPNIFTEVESNDWSTFALDSINKLAYLRIKSFGDRKEYKDFYEVVFQKLETHHTYQLILDLRDNTGGYFGNGYEFLTYFMDKEFQFTFRRPKKDFEKNEYTWLGFWSKLTKVAFSLKPDFQDSETHRYYSFSYKPNKPRFKNQVHVITNGLTFSLAGVVASALSEQGAIFYGTEAGGGAQRNQAMLMYQLELPNSGFVAKVPYYQIVINSTKTTFGHGVIPDYKILPKIADEEDYVLNETIHYILK